MSRGEGIFYVKVDAWNIQKTIKIETSDLRTGINKLTLLNYRFEPLSERLVFVEKEQGDIVNIDIKSDKEAYRIREKVTLKIKAGKNVPRHEPVTLSLAVIDESATNSDGVRNDIKSGLLLDSELRGIVDSPSDYFRDNEKADSELKLDLLMLTNGWRNYIWDSPDPMYPEKIMQASLGINIQGILRNYTGKKMISYGNLTLTVSNEEGTSLYSTYSDNDGNFEFSEIAFNDSASIYIQGKNQKEKLWTQVDLTQFKYQPIKVSDMALASMARFNDEPVSLMRIKRLNNLSPGDYYPGLNTLVIKEVDVKAAMPEIIDDHVRDFGKPDVSRKVEDKFRHYNNIFDYMQGRFAGVEVDGASVRIRGAFGKRTSPLYLIDGNIASKSSVALLSMNDVDVIDVYKGNSTTIFGARGANGVISVFTRKGSQNQSPEKEVAGTLFEKLKGFTSQCEFYSPLYTAENLHSEKPDFRTTLYWNPSVELKNGKAEVSFYSCDEIDRYTIYAEGISGEGKICIGQDQFEVNRYFNSDDP